MTSKYIEKYNVILTSFYIITGKFYMAQGITSDILLIIDWIHLENRDKHKKKKR
jgi:hypothetical protein